MDRLPRLRPLWTPPTTPCTPPTTPLTAAPPIAPAAATPASTVRLAAWTAPLKTSIFAPSLILLIERRFNGIRYSCSAACLPLPRARQPSRIALPAGSRPSQFFPRPPLYQQWNEIAQGARVESPIALLDYRSNVSVRKLCVLLGKATLNRLDVCPLFLRHARNRIH